MVNYERVEVDARLRVGLDLQRAGRFEDFVQFQANLHVDQRLAFVGQVHDHLPHEREVARQRRAGGVSVRGRAAAGSLVSFPLHGLPTPIAISSVFDRRFGRVCPRPAQAMVEDDFQLAQIAVGGQLDRFAFEVAPAEHHVADRRVEQLDAHL